MENMSRKEARADFTEVPVITVHKKNLDKYKAQIVDDIKVLSQILNLRLITFSVFHFSELQFSCC